MGWVSGTLPEGVNFSARAAIEFEQGPEFYEKRVIDHALVGSTIYAAIRVNDTDLEHEIIGMVMLTERRDGELYTKGMTEEMGPAEDECPWRILDLLSPTDSDNATEWRQRCRERADLLARVKFGARVTFAQPYETLTGDGREFVCVDAAKGLFQPFGVEHPPTCALASWRSNVKEVQD